MTRKNKIILGGVMGMMLPSFISSTYFYTFFKKAMRRLDRSLLGSWDFNF